MFVCDRPVSVAEHAESHRSWILPRILNVWRFTQRLPKSRAELSPRPSLTVLLPLGASAVRLCSRFPKNVLIGPCPYTAKIKVMSVSQVQAFYDRYLFTFQ